MWQFTASYQEGRTLNESTYSPTYMTSQNVLKWQIYAEVKCNYLNILSYFIKITNYLA